MSIPIKWPEDMTDAPSDSNTEIKIINDENDEPESQITRIDEELEIRKPQEKQIVEQSNLFDLPPIELDCPEEPQIKKKKKFCGRECIKDGEVKKCREPVETCIFHICDECKEGELNTDECPHKLTHNFDRKPPRLNKQTGAEHLYNLQFSCYLTMETLLARTDAKYRVDGLTQKLEEKRDAYKICLEEIYDEYGSEIDSVVSPIMTWAMLTSVDVGTSVYENQKKGPSEDT